jgi:hypothetical protein
MSAASDVNEWREPGATWAGVLAGIAPYVLFGLAVMVHKASPYLPVYPLFYGAVLAGLAVGAARRFPLWSMPYLAWTLLLTWSGMGMSWLSPGWQTWLVGLGLALALGLLVARSPEPLRALGRRLWHDWSWVSLVVYTFWCWVVGIFDENHHQYLLVLVGLASAAAVAGAALYLRSPAGLARTLSLLPGLVGVMLVGVYSDLTWDYAVYHNLPVTDTPSRILLRWLMVSLVAAALVLGGPVLRRVLERADIQRQA